MTGSEGRLGHRLLPAFPDAIRLDLLGEPDVCLDLLSNDPLPECDLIVHLAAEKVGPLGVFDQYVPTLRIAERVVLTAIRRKIPVVFASSVWAARIPLTPYGVVKRCIEQMVDSHGGASVRVGWIGWTEESLARADDFHKRVAWTDERLVSEFLAAVDRVL